MDPALLKQRQAFLNKASTNVSVQQKPAVALSHTTYVSEDQKKKRKKKAEDSEKAKPANQMDYKSATSVSNAANFAIMAKIVDFMKKRHLEGNQWTLLLKEALEEMQIYDVTKKQEIWLNDALPKNPRLQINKRKDIVYFYNDPETDYQIEQEFTELWRTCGGVEHLDENKIAEYLQKHGIASVKDLAPKRVMIGPPKRKGVKRRANVNIQNQHIIEDLVDYGSV